MCRMTDATRHHTPEKAAESISLHPLKGEDVVGALVGTPPDSEKIGPLFSDEVTAQFADHEGQWVAISGASILGASSSFSGAALAADKAGVSDALIHFVLSPDLI